MCIQSCTIRALNSAIRVSIRSIRVRTRVCVSWRSQDFIVFDVTRSFLTYRYSDTGTHPYRVSVACNYGSSLAGCGTFLASCLAHVVFMMGVYRRLVSGRESGHNVIEVFTTMCKTMRSTTAQLITPVRNCDTFFPTVIRISLKGLAGACNVREPVG